MSTERQDDELTEQELRVAELHMHGNPYRKIGLELGINHSYAWQILHRPHVLAWIRRVRLDMQDATRESLVRLMPKAANALVEVMTNAKASPAARVSAAKVILDMGIPAPPQRVELTTPPTPTEQVLEGASDEALFELAKRIGLTLPT